MEHIIVKKYDGNSEDLIGILENNQKILFKLREFLDPIKGIIRKTSYSQFS